MTYSPTDVERYTALVEQAVDCTLPGHYRPVVAALLQLLAADDRIVGEQFRVLEEWAVRSEDGEVYGVHDDSYTSALTELVKLRGGVDGDPDQPGEPDARLVHRFRLVHRRTLKFRVTTWMHIPTAGDPPNPLPAYLRRGDQC